MLSRGPLAGAFLERSEVDGAGGIDQFPNHNHILSMYGKKNLDIYA